MTYDHNPRFTFLVMGECRLPAEHGRLMLANLQGCNEARCVTRRSRDYVGRFGGHLDEQPSSQTTLPYRHTFRRQFTFRHGAPNAATPEQAGAARVILTTL